MAYGLGRSSMKSSGDLSIPISSLACGESISNAIMWRQCEASNEGAALLAIGWVGFGLLINMQCMKLTLIITAMRWRGRPGRPALMRRYSMREDIVQQNSKPSASGAATERREVMQGALMASSHSAWRGLRRHGRSICWRARVSRVRHFRPGRHWGRNQCGERGYRVVKPRDRRLASPALNKCRK